VSPGPFDFLRVTTAAAYALSYRVQHYLQHITKG